MARSGRVFPRRSPMRAPLAALTRVPTSRLRSGAWHGRLAPSRRALLGLARRRALQRRGAGAEGERGPQQDPAAGGGGGAERGGGRAEGGREPASERASEDSSARDSPLSLPSSSALRSFFPNSRPRPPHLWSPLTLAGSAGPEAEPGRASGEGAGGGNRYLGGTLPPPSLLPGPCTAGARGLGGVFPRFWGPPHRVENCPRAVSVWRAPRTLTLREWRRGRVLGVIPSQTRAPFAATALHPPAPVGQRCPRTGRIEGNRIERQGCVRSTPRPGP